MPRSKLGNCVRCRDRWMLRGDTVAGYSVLSSLCYQWYTVQIRLTVGLLMLWWPLVRIVTGCHTMSHTDHLHVETKLLPVKYHSELLAKQYWLSCYQSHHPCHHLTTLPAPARNMKGTLMKFNSEVVPLSAEGITDVDTYRDCLRTLHSQAVVDISPLESLLPRSVRTTLAQCPVAFWSLSAFEHLQGPHHQRHIRCLSGVWSGTTLRRASFHLSQPSDAAYSGTTRGTTRLRSQTYSTWTTDDRRRAAGLSQQQQPLVRGSVQFWDEPEVLDIILSDERHL